MILHLRRVMVETGRFSVTEFFFPGLGINSLPSILRRIADPVEPFGFTFVKNELQPPLLDGIGERLGKQPDLFDQLDEGQANKLQWVHRPMQQFSLNSPQIPATS